MNTSSQVPADLYNSLKGSLIAAEVLHTSSKISDATLLQNIIYKLHTKRKRFPNYERLISKAIFKIYDRVFYESSDFMRQSARVATFCGFTQAPTQDMAVAKELLNRIPMDRDIKVMIPSFQAIMENTVNLYTSQNYQTKDPNRTVAYRLKALIQMLAPYAKIQPEKQQIYNCATALESAQPIFKGFARSYTPPTPRKKCCVICKEPVDVYRRIPFQSRGNSSRIDDRN